MGKQEFNWDQFFSLVQAKMVIPVIGSDIVRMKNDSKLLYDYLRIALLKELPKGLRDDKEDLTLMEFTEKYSDNFLAGPKAAIQPIYKKVQHEEVDLKPLQELARITDFDIYINTSIDDCFQKVLAEERCKKEEEINVINYSLTKYAHSQSHKKSPVSLVNILGNINQRDDFAITDEETLEYIFSVRKGFEDIPGLIDKISGKSLLFIGCGFPDWLLRFTIRIISNQRFAERRIGKIIADYKTHLDPKLSSFLRHYKSTIIPIPGDQFKDTFDFISQMYQKWTDHHATNVSERYDGAVFLSYCSEDRKLLELVSTRLRSRGVDVWYDQEKLESGANYSDRIKKEIKQCRVFVPFITENAIKDKTRYVYATEWKIAESRKVFLEDDTFLKPFIFDKTEVTDERIPKIFRNITIKQFVMDDFIEDVISRLDRL